MTSNEWVGLHIMAIFGWIFIVGGVSLLVGHHYLAKPFIAQLRETRASRE